MQWKCEGVQSYSAAERGGKPRLRTCCPTRVAYASMIFFIFVVFLTLNTVSSPSAREGRAQVCSS